jgi:chemotaxis protein methyltransferase CheR
VAEKRQGKYRIWSSACSTGQEPYSIAMTINEYFEKHPSLGLNLGNFEIIATDISPSVLFIASNGRYDNLAMRRGMDDYYKNKYFEQDGPIWSINDNIKKCISFKKVNLQDSLIGLGLFDIIFCRNVIIYFSDKFKKELFAKFTHSLAKNGFFILGSAETTFGYTDTFERINVNNGVYYKVKLGG